MSDTTKQPEELSRGRALRKRMQESGAEARADERIRTEIANIPYTFIEERVEPLYKLTLEGKVTHREWIRFHNDFNHKLQDYEQAVVQSTHAHELKEIFFATPLYEDERGRHVVYTNRYNTDLHKLEPVDEDLVADEVLSGLAADEDINVFIRGDRIGRVIKTKDLYKWDAVPEKGMGRLISEGCAIVSYKEDKKDASLEPELQVPVPRYIKEAVLSYQDYEQLKQLEAIYTYPYVHKDSLVVEHGYNPESQIYVPPTASLEIDYPESSEEAVTILTDLLQGFKFKSEADFENAIALALTPLIRPNIPDGVPLFCITAPSQGSGKSFLCQTLWSILQGTKVGVTELETNEEMGKKLFSIISDALPYVLFDNVDSYKPLDSGLLASFVTDTKRTARLFHTQKTATIENFSIVCYTGTSAQASMELVSRMVQIRLKAPTDRNAKIYYEFDPIVDRIQKDQPRYLGALMYMVRKWVEAGCPQIDKTKEQIDEAKKGSEQVHRLRHWARQMHGLLDINGLGQHFLANDGEMRIDSSPEEVEMGRFLNEVARELTPEVAMKGWQVKDIFEIASYRDGQGVSDTDDSPTNLLSRWVDKKRLNSEQARKSEVGRVLLTYKDKPFSGWTLEKVGVRRGATVFRLVDNGGLDEYRTETEEQQTADLRAPVNNDNPVSRIDQEEERKVIEEERRAIQDSGILDDIEF